MAILLRVYKAVPFKNEIRLTNMIFIREFRYANTHDFGFDTSNALLVRKFLQKWKFSDGKLLPRRSVEGYRMSYNMYRMGGHPGYVSLYPGSKADGTRRKVHLQGYLD